MGLMGGDRLSAGGGSFRVEGNVMIGCDEISMMMGGFFGFQRGWVSVYDIVVLVVRLLCCGA